MITAGQVRDHDATGHWYIHPPTGRRLPSYTGILDATCGKPWLVPWSAKVIAEYCVTNWRQIARVIRTEGPAAGVKLAKDQAEIIRQRKADAGTYVHAVVEALILWAAEPGHGANVTIPDLPEHLANATYDDQPLADVVAWMIDGFTAFAADFAPRFDAAEMIVFNLALGVAGTLDMIITLHGVVIARDGRLVAAPGQSVTILVDVKTGKNLDVTVPEQLAGYAHSTEALLPLGEIAAMPAVDATAVLHLRPGFKNGYRLILISPADAAAAWNRLRRAVELYDGRRAVAARLGEVACPLLPDGTLRPPWVADLHGRVPARLAEAGVDTLAELACLSAADCLKLPGIGPKSLPVIRGLLAGHDLHLDGEAPIPGCAACAAAAACLAEAA